MKHKSLFLFLSIFYLINTSNCQLLDINKPLFTDDPFFNKNFIKENNIKSITGSRSSKKIQDIIRSKGLDFYYEFNNQGLLVKQIATYFLAGQNKDTNIISYNYNDNGKLILRRKSDNYGYYSHQYQLDELGRITKQTYNREENTYECKANFELCQRYKISTDSFSYEQIDKSQLKKLFYNNYGKVYKQQTNYYNEFGYLIEEYGKFLIGNSKSKITYQYDELGRLIERSEFTDITNDKKITETYLYDEIGNVLEIKEYINGIPITLRQFLYDKKTMLLTAQLIKDIETEFLRIIQYHYTFYDGYLAE